MRLSLRVGLLAGALTALLRLSSAADAPGLVAQPPLVAPRSAGFFDYMAVDEKYRRLLVAHTGSRTLDIIDLSNDTLARQIDVGEGHGVAVDVRDGKYFVGTSRPPYIVDIQRKFMVKQDQVPSGGPIDAIAFDSHNDVLYADRADTGQVVGYNAKTKRVVATVSVGSDLEYIVYDPVSDRIYQNVVSSNKVSVIDPNSNTVVASWPAAPAANLRGLAVDGAAHRLFVAGANGKLTVMDDSNGSVIGVVDVAPGVDQIAFDPGNKKLYCASGTGQLSVVQETDIGAKSLGDATVPRHAHTVAVDPVTHSVWISYGAADNDYVMKLVQAPPSPTPSP